MKKLLGILALSFLCFNISFANQDEIEKMITKTESYNLGLSKKDTTVQGLKLKPLTYVNSYKYSVKKNYGWTKYGLRVVNSSEGLPIRYGDTALRFELHYDDCGFLYKNNKERDCKRSNPHHRFEIGTSKNKKSLKGYKHKQDYWYTFSYFLPKEHKFYRKQSIYQFHSSEGPYNPPFQIEIKPKKGLLVKVATSEGVFEDKEGDCGGSIKEEINYCEKAQITYLIMRPYELKKNLGKWIDVVIHAVWDKRPTKNENNNGMFEVFFNGEKKIHYEGQTMWDAGLSVMRIGIYQDKKAAVFQGKSATLQQMKDTPTIVFYDEIWAKKKCKDLKIKRLGYSCQNLEKQSDKITKPYNVSYNLSEDNNKDNNKIEVSYLVVIKNKNDPNYIYKVKGKNKEEVEKKGLMKCKQTFPDLSGSGNTGCYVHYSSQVRFGQ